MNAPAPPSETNLAPIPLTVIGGFLGAGKTTLVNAALAQAQGRRLAILVNDFGELSIDASLVSARSAQTLSLANGCVCCTLVNGLVQALIDVLRIVPPPEHVLVEASGVSDPGRIAQIARADRAFVEDATLVVVAADQIRTLARDRYVGETVVRQIASADLVVLNKVDLVDPGQQEEIVAWLRERAPSSVIVCCVDAELPLEAVLGASRASLDRRVREADPVWHSGTPPVDHARAFSTRTFRSGGALSEPALRSALERLAGGVLRAKGFVRFETSPETWWLVQAVGRRWSITRAPENAAPDDCVLVVVGAGQALASAVLHDLARAFGER